MGYAEAIAAAAIDGIWKATGMANKPYVHAFYVDTMAAHTSHGDRHTLQDGDNICIYARPKQPTSKKTIFHIISYCLKTTYGHLVESYYCAHASKYFLS